MRNDNYHRGVWKKGEETVTGTWVWSYFQQRFIITLDKRDEITGRKIHFEVGGEGPDFNGWKLVDEVKREVSDE